jgi:hypothetical protein
MVWGATDGRLLPGHMHRRGEGQKKCCFYAAVCCCFIGPIRANKLGAQPPNPQRPTHLDPAVRRDGGAQVLQRERRGRREINGLSRGLHLGVWGGLVGGRSVGG